MKSTKILIAIVILMNVLFITSSQAQQLKFYDKTNDQVMTNVKITDQTMNIVNATQISDLKDGMEYKAERLNFQPVGFTKASAAASGGWIYMTPNDQTLGEVVITASKNPQNQNDVPYLVNKIGNKEIAKINASTSAHLLEQSGKAFVQMSQMGGGSPVLRGFEANRVLLMVDGIRLNNGIYRAGHLQDIITVDVNQVDKAEILFGPSSLLYGSDAIGGVIHLMTKSPHLNINNDRKPFSAEIGGRINSAFGEKTGNIMLEYSGKKFANLTAVSYSDFGDLMSGKSENPFDSTFWLRNQYVEVINGKDSIVNNSDPYKQINSGYSQYNILNKSIFQLNSALQLSLNLQYSSSSDIPRYDRLTQRQNGVLRFAEWNYGPQERLLVSPALTYTPYHAHLYDKLKIQPYIQKVSQQRITRRLNKTSRFTQTEDVTVVGLNVDINKDYSNGISHYGGVEYILNDVSSNAEELNIKDNTTKPSVTRYPPGTNTMQDMGIYSKWVYKHNKYTLDGGLRFQYRSLSSQVGDATFYPVLIPDFAQNNGSLSGNLGISYAVCKSNLIKAAISRAYRAPNFDDLGKIFDSSPGNVIVPSSDVKPETANSLEISWINQSANHSLHITPFGTLLNNAIVTAKGTFNGQDSILYQNVLSKVLVVTNAAEAVVYGVQAGFDLSLNPNWNLEGNITYTKGTYTPKSTNTEVPLDHIPPLFGRLRLGFEKGKLSAGLSVLFNGKKQLKDYSPSGEDNLDQATPNGMPAWVTGNIYAGMQLNKFNIGLGIDNILDTHYRVFASGINGAGRNFKLSLSYKI